MKVEQSLVSPPYMLLSAVNFFSWLSYNMVTPVLSGYALSLGTSLSMAGMLSGLFVLAALISRPFSGLVSDMRNRKQVMAVFTGLMALSTLLYGLIPQIWALMLFRAIQGISFSLASTASLAMIGDIVPERLLSKAVNFFGLSSIAASAIGPGLGVLIVETQSHQVCVLAGGWMLIAATAVAFATPYRAPNREKALSMRITLSGLVEKNALPFAVVNSTFTLINGVVSAYLVMLASERGIPGVNWHFMISAIALIAVRLLLTGLDERIRLGTKLYLSIACYAACLPLIAFAHSLWPLVLSGVLKAVGQGIGMPALQTETLRQASPWRRGVAGSTIYIGGDLGQAVGPMLGGLVAQGAGYGGMFNLCALPLIAALFAIGCKIPGQRRSDARDAEDVPCN